MNMEVMEALENARRLPRREHLRGSEAAARRRRVGVMRKGVG